MELKKKIIFDQKKLVVMENMEFTVEEGKAFWPVYEKHQEELFQVSQRGATLILAYASVYQSLTDEQATKIIDEYYDIQDDSYPEVNNKNPDASQVWRTPEPVQGKYLYRMEYW